MGKFKLERENPEYIKNRAIEVAVERLKQTIINENLRITPAVEEKLDSLLGKLEEEGIFLAKEEILRKSLEILAIEQGGFPEKLEAKFIELLASEIANKVDEEKNLYQVLSKEMIELKRKGIEVEAKKVEEKIKEKLKERGEGFNL